MSKNFTDEDWWALPISNDFMFSKVMRDEDLRKEIIELLLQKPVGKVVDFQEEKTINMNYDSKSVRLDVYLRDEEKRINVEMQVSDRDDLRKRSRYYHALIDLDALESGQTYDQLGNNYVIFICTFDEVGNGRGRNSYQMYNDDTDDVLEDGIHTLFFNATAWKSTEDEKLRAFLSYVMGEVSSDSLVQKLEKRLHEVKGNEQWRVEFMKYEADRQILVRDARMEGKLEGILEGKLEGKLEGILEGKLEGIVEKSLEVARNLLGRMGIAEIAQVTNLPVEQVQQLALEG